MGWAGASSSGLLSPVCLDSSPCQWSPVFSRGAQADWHHGTVTVVKKMERVGSLEAGSVRSRCRRDVRGGTDPSSSGGLGATWQVGCTDVVTGLVQQVREGEASRPTPQLPAGAADGQGCQSLSRGRGPSEESTFSSACWSHAHLGQLHHRQEESPDCEEAKAKALTSPGWAGQCWGQVTRARDCW